MDRATDYKAKWNRLFRERQIPYDLSYVEHEKQNTQAKEKKTARETNQETGS